MPNHTHSAINSTALRGLDVLRDPLLNRGTAFTELAGTI